ncbi:hypothetical protein ATDW_25900 [Asticcacaulis sp. DW145]|uniref:hypothetical protein n=1 Tax=Asticcacaulis sp. DW145 TaxID=3095608 RepID=UPI00308D09CF|nr:hypothetical protein ATDW_25900 [Asticcacaulis sp. DW145]
MAISVDIADRQYDYTDEEAAAEAVARFQLETGLGDTEILALWTGSQSPQRQTLEFRIIEAVDLNGSAKRAAETVPNGITLFVETEAA